MSRLSVTEPDLSKSRISRNSDTLEGLTLFIFGNNGLFAGANEIYRVFEHFFCLIFHYMLFSGNITEISVQEHIALPEYSHTNRNQIQLASLHLCDIFPKDQP